MQDEALSATRNRKLGFVFQFYHLLPEFTALENAAMPRLIGSGGAARREAYAQAERLLTQAGMGGRLGHYPNQLSGGEKQRVAIVRALINEPEVLLCDEPTGNLDSHTGSGIIRLLKSLGTARRMTLVIVTHNAELAAQMDKTYKLADGVVLA
jgi:lipoprotein-releasing system ATP-binding protein